MNDNESTIDQINCIHLFGAGSRFSKQGNPLNHINIDATNTFQWIRFTIARMLFNTNDKILESIR